MTNKAKEESAVSTAALAGNNGFSIISNEKLLELYVSLVKCRMIEERVRLLSGRREVAGDGIAVAGREAGAVGVAIGLLPEDTVAHSQRDFAAGFIKGAPLAGVLSSLLAGTAGSKPADYLSLAMSAATSSKTEKNGGIAVVFYSEASGAPADWLRALSEAAASRLPILFVCQTKLLAKRAEIGTPAFSEQIALHARKCGLPAIPVDGSDLVAVYRVATEAIAHARKGNGATLIECAACRPEIEPIPKMEAYLSRKGLFSQELKREVRAGFSRELDAAVEAAGKGAVSV